MAAEYILVLIMPEFRRYPNEGFPYLVTTVIKDRRPLFADERFCRIAMDSLAFLRVQRGHRVHAYVLMPDHVHLLITPKEDGNISEVMQSFKRYTAKYIGNLSGRRGGIWQPRFYERAVIRGDDAETALAYIHHNPVNAGLANEPEHYAWSSYRSCILGEAGLMEVDPLFC